MVKKSGKKSKERDMEKNNTLTFTLDGKDLLEVKWPKGDVLQIKIQPSIVFYNDGAVYPLIELPWHICRTVSNARSIHTVSICYKDCQTSSYNVIEILWESDEAIAKRIKEMIFA